MLSFLENPKTCGTNVHTLETPVNNWLNDLYALVGDTWKIQVRTLTLWFLFLLQQGLTT
jgi:hypothetical protein